MVNSFLIFILLGSIQNRDYIFPPKRHVVECQLVKTLYCRIVKLSKLYNVEYYFSLHMHAKPSFAHRLQTAKMASSRTSAQNNGPRAQKKALGCKIIALR